MAVADSGHGKASGYDGFGLPFGYRLERDDVLLILLILLILGRADGSEVALFDAVGLDPFEVMLAVWEDAD
jgi:hypothetical protein